MNVLIIEDEAVAARHLERLVVEALGGRTARIRRSESLGDAFALLAAEPAELVFLDLNLSGEDGFEVLRRAAAEPFATIVVSGSTERAIEAFAFGVLDFIPKPVEKARLIRAIERLSRAPAAGETAAEVLVVKDLGALRVVKLADIAYLKGGGDYAEIHLRNGSFLLHSKTLESLSTILPPGWVRVHKSYIVETSGIVRLAVHGGGRYECILADGLHIPVGRSRYKDLVTLLGGGASPE